MKILNCLVGAAVFVTTPVGAQQPVPPAPDPDRVAAAREFVAIALPAASREAMMDSIINSMMRNMTAGMLQGDALKAQFAQHPAMRSVFDRFIGRQRELVIADLRDNMPQLLHAETDAYARIFTVDELHQLTAFLGQPVGQKYIAAVPKVFADPEVAAWQQGVAIRAQQRMPGEIERFKADMKTAVGASGSK